MAPEFFQFSGKNFNFQIPNQAVITKFFNSLHYLLDASLGSPEETLYLDDLRSYSRYSTDILMMAMFCCQVYRRELELFSAEQRKINLDRKEDLK